MSAGLNPFFTSSYAAAAIPALFAALPRSARHPGTASGIRFAPPGVQCGVALTVAVPITTARVMEVTAANCSISKDGTRTASCASIAIQAPSPSLHDLAVEEMILTGNRQGLARPSVGPSKFVDALMQLATGSDVALAIAARSLLPRITSCGDYALDGHEIVTLRNDPVLDEAHLRSIPGLAAAIQQGEDWGDGAIMNIAVAMADGNQPDGRDVNFLRAKLFGCLSFADAESTSGSDGTSCSVTEGNCYFDLETSAETGTHEVMDFSAVSVQAKFREF